MIHIVASRCIGQPGIIRTDLIDHALLFILLSLLAGKVKQSSKRIEAQPMIGLPRPECRAQRTGVRCSATLPPKMYHGISPAQELLCRYSSTKTSRKVVQKANAVDLQVSGGTTGCDEGNRSVMALMSDTKGLQQWLNLGQLRWRQRLNLRLSGSYLLVGDGHCELVLCWYGVHAFLCDTRR